MDRDRLKYWLALTRVRGLELFFLRGLLDRLGEPREIFEGAAHIEGFSTALKDGVAGFKEWDWVEKELDLIDKDGARAITFNDPGYPELLKQIHDPPALLYAKGAFPERDLPAIAIVGTRHPTHYGLKMAETLGRDLGGMGAVVVSGMARGCDMAAHKGALSAKGKTIAVLGTGVDVAYPKENKRLYDEIVETGLVLSELPMSTPPAPYNFPKRNRIISGLALGVLVVEAPLRSGSLMTARLALDYNREVLSVPGQATSYKSAGSNKLLKDGAFLVENAADVMEALSLSYRPLEKGPAGPELGEDERIVWKTLGDEPQQIDSIIDKTGLSVTRASALLLDLELKGFIQQLPGKCFLRKF